ncbi:peptide chain release factor N(5)-glutamine methyltransferase [Candidatus Peregrinibacteria bacterium]|nr:peptide chain release factor N(5)-glutamine methyltransferase [Candidatus Peregrinibacteria bacterium]
MDVKTVLKWGVGALNASSESARLDAEVLLAYALKKPVTFLLAHDDSRMPLFSLWRYQRLIGKRRQGIPVAYITGTKEFYFLDFEVTPDVLIPRPDTETLAEAVVDYLNSQLQITNYEFNHFLLLDVGTGSGCVPISILKNVDGVQAVATDISGKALKVAHRNAKKHGVSDRLTFIESNLLEGVPSPLLQGRDLIVTANLPYVPEGYPVTRSVHFEPSMAVYGGKDGLDLYRRFLRQLLPLKPRAVFLELLEFQQEALRNAFPCTRSRVIKSLADQVRFVVFERD